MSHDRGMQEAKRDCGLYRRDDDIETTAYWLLRRALSHDCTFPRPANAVVDCVRVLLGKEPIPCR